jgi:hypothetical protein
MGLTSDRPHSSMQGLTQLRKCSHRLHPRVRPPLPTLTTTHRHSLSSTGSPHVLTLSDPLCLVHPPQPLLALSKPSLPPLPASPHLVFSLVRLVAPLPDPLQCPSTPPRPLQPPIHTLCVTTTTYHTSNKPPPPPTPSPALPRVPQSTPSVCRC